MRSSFRSAALACLMSFGLMAGALANDRYSPRPPVLLGSGPEATERTPERSARPAAPAMRTAGLMPRPGKPKGASTARTLDPAFLPAVVSYDGREAPGTIVIDTRSRYLYLVEAGGTARRYGVGVGKPGFAWVGSHKISRKAEWPTWTPPPAMRARKPGLPIRMAGGPNNPLGARAMYLGSSLYRIHGSNEPWSIGKAVSSGCFRMRNEDVTDLYGRVGVGTRVIVR